jgi:hypothetical protein
VTYSLSFTNEQSQIYHLTNYHVAKPESELIPVTINISRAEQEIILSEVGSGGMRNTQQATLPIPRTVFSIVNIEAK